MNLEISDNKIHVTFPYIAPEGSEFELETVVRIAALVSAFFLSYAIAGFAGLAVFGITGAVTYCTTLPDSHPEGDVITIESENHEKEKANADDAANYSDTIKSLLETNAKITNEKTDLESQLMILQSQLNEANEAATQAFLEKENGRRPDTGLHLVKLDGLTSQNLDLQDRLEQVNRREADLKLQLQRAQKESDAFKKQLSLANELGKVVLSESTKDKEMEVKDKDFVALYASEDIKQIISVLEGSLKEKPLLMHYFSVIIKQPLNKSIIDAIFKNASLRESFREAVIIDDALSIVCIYGLDMRVVNFLELALNHNSKSILGYYFAKTPPKYALGSYLINVDLLSITAKNKEVILKMLSFGEACDDPGSACEMLEEALANLLKKHSESLSKYANELQQEADRKTFDQEMEKLLQNLRWLVSIKALHFKEDFIKHVPSISKLPTKYLVKISEAIFKKMDIVTIKHTAIGILKSKGNASDYLFMREMALSLDPYFDASMLYEFVQTPEFEKAPASYSKQLHLLRQNASLDLCHTSTAKAKPILLRCLEKGHLKASEEILPFTDNITCCQFDVDVLGVLTYGSLATMHMKKENYSYHFISGLLAKVTAEIDADPTLLGNCINDLIGAWILTTCNELDLFDIRDRISYLINKRKDLFTFERIDAATAAINKLQSGITFLYDASAAEIDRKSMVEKLSNPILFFRSQGIALKKYEVEKERWSKEQHAEIQAINCHEELFRIFMSSIESPKLETYHLSMEKLHGVLEQLIPQIALITKEKEGTKEIMGSDPEFMMNWQSELVKIWKEKYGDETEAANFSGFLTELIFNSNFGTHKMPYVFDGDVKTKPRIKQTTFIQLAFKFMGHIRNEELVSGTPSDKEELKKFYTAIKEKLRVIIYSAYAPKKEEESTWQLDRFEAYSVLSSLVYTNQKCAGNWSNEIETRYNRILFNSLSDLFPIKMKKAVNQFKIGVIENWVKSYTEHVRLPGMAPHYKRAIIDTYGDFFGLIERGKIIEKYADFARDDCGSLNYISQRINRSTTLQFIRDQFKKGGMLNDVVEVVNWIKHNFVGKWKATEYAAERQRLAGVLESNLKELSQKELSKADLAKQVWDALLVEANKVKSDKEVSIGIHECEEFFITSISTVEDTATLLAQLKESLANATELERERAFYGEEVLDESGNIKDYVLLNTLLFEGL